MNVKKVIDVSKNSFYPVPDVDSTVIMLERKEKPDFEILDEDLFLMVNKLLFRQRRKTIVNNLKDTYNKDDILIILNNLGINVLARSESLTIKQIIDISNELSKIGK